MAETIPAAIVPPQPSALMSSHPARGVQIYTCPASAKGWALKAPEALLLDAGGKPFAHHFAGPTWQAGDGSKVVGAVLAKVPAPKAGAVAWLLLTGQATGPGVLSGTRYVQRIDTQGGAAPSGACPVGKELRVPYSATYNFYR